MNVLNQKIAFLLGLALLMTPLLGIGQTTTQTQLPAVNTYPLAGPTVHKTTYITGPKNGGSSFYLNKTGYIQIRLPVHKSGAYMRMKLEFYNWLNDKSFTVLISGADRGNSWQKCSATILSSSKAIDCPVYFGEDGTYSYIWIGALYINEGYARLTEVMLGRIEYADVWATNWSVTFKEQIDFNNVRQTVTNTKLNNSLWTEEEINGVDAVSYPGEVHAREVRVYVDAGADFVFEEDYDLMRLEELESFVNQNKHLPGIPSEKEMVQKGMPMAEMNTSLLQKVEELTLYMIQLNKELEELKAKKE